MALPIINNLDFFSLSTPLVLRIEAKSEETGSVNLLRRRSRWTDSHCSPLKDH